MADVEFYGEKFTLSDQVSEFALMEFADAAADGEDGDTMQGMASMLRLVRECVTPTDWVRFRGLARKNKAGAEQLLPVLQAAFENTAERPTGRPSDSTDGPASTVQRSASNSDAKTSLAGRPDLQLAIMKQRSA